MHFPLENRPDRLLQNDPPSHTATQTRGVHRAGDGSQNELQRQQQSCLTGTRKASHPCERHSTKHQLQPRQWVEGAEPSAKGKLSFLSIHLCSPTSSFQKEGQAPAAVTADWRHGQSQLGRQRHQNAAVQQHGLPRGCSDPTSEHYSQ